MLPFFRYSWIFKSRWMALFWAASICWFALDTVGTAPTDANNSSAIVTDVSGADASQDDVKRVEQTLKNL